MTDPPAGTPRIDLHVHLAGVGTQGSGCWTSPSLRRRYTFAGMRVMLGITARQMDATVDQDWAEFLSSLVAESDLDLAVVLGFDAVYDSRGLVDLSRSQMIVPPSWVFEVCGRYANLLPAPSINPVRRDALELLEESIERGAVMIKWLPIVQGFDPAAARIRPFLRRLADADIPLLIHAGTGELTFATVDPGVGGLDRIAAVLEEGVTVVCAHTAAPIHFSREHSELPLLREMLARYPNLWVDNSGLANPARFRHLPHFAADERIAERTLHGSDFPVPSNATFYGRRIGWRFAAALDAEKNPLQRDLRIKQSLGFPSSSFTRAAGLLANFDRWYVSPPLSRSSGSGASPE